MEASLHMTTVADPLSAGLMTMSVWTRSLVRASHLFTSRLSGLLLEQPSDMFQEWGLCS